MPLMKAHDNDSEEVLHTDQERWQNWVWEQSEVTKSFLRLGSYLKEDERLQQELLLFQARLL